MPTKPNPLPKRAFRLVDDALMTLAEIDEALQLVSKGLEPLMGKTDAETLIRAARAKEKLAEMRLAVRRAGDSLTDARATGGGEND